MIIPAQETVSAPRKEWLRKWVVLISAMESLLETGIKISAALYTGSTGLLADCIHSLGDVVGSLMVWIGVRVANKKYKKFPYGFYKIENLLALGIGFAIIYGAYEIILIFFAGKATLPQNIPVGITAVVIAILLDFFWGRFEAKSGRLINSPGVEASGNHTLSDVYSSVVVLIGLIGSYFGYNLDRWSALIVAIIISKMGVEILWKNIIVLLDMTLPTEKLDAYTKLITRQPGVLSVKTIRGRNSGSFRFVDIDISIKVNSLSMANSMASEMENKLKEFDSTIDAVFVHYCHDLPETILIVVPTDEHGLNLSPFFGKATHLTFLKYNRKIGQLSDVRTEINPMAANSEHRGIDLALRLIDQSIDSVCCRENLHDKGPGLMFYRFGIDVRKTEETLMATLFNDYFGNSDPIFPDAYEQKVDNHA